jgi:hypothetical protein
MKNSFEESSDEGAVRRRRDRCMELAAMFKEHKSGSPSILNSILAKFSLQEGVTQRRAKEYFNLLVSAKLITWKYGHKHWEYNKNAEWELFQIEI